MKLSSAQVIPKNFHYKTDGTGRDSYIATNNGGFFPAKRVMEEYPVSSLRPKRCIVPNASNTPHRIVRYHSNGTGRDSYITTCSGGFQSMSNSERSTRFEANLRNYRPFSATYTRAFVYKQRKEERIISARQKELVSRLSKPRYARV
mmetsp:Transcript_14153/g.20702  ORF Transcript_14153/g.20702 Transcript_14153/m.20702 type:complete len:147 (+) Transcript_14153:30-470(+)